MVRLLRKRVLPTVIAGVVATVTGGAAVVATTIQNVAPVPQNRIFKNSKSLNEALHLRDSITSIDPGYHASIALLHHLKHHINLLIVGGLVLASVP